MYYTELHYTAINAQGSTALHQYNAPYLTLMQYFHYEFLDAQASQKEMTVRADKPNQNYLTTVNNSTQSTQQLQ